ncbi:cytochrome b561 [Thiothrix eikelboomii]|uniref:Cytochrome b561 n=1 Tax=Thiothrix eikelboomii TaxID=92487 RepID=A0A1T4WKU4_9GAMM|nr:cytochrome b [Thiothrix eikelboomii]SKA77281.1 cytochrome b561 [Thiothrix eikelboomii]
MSHSLNRYGLFPIAFHWLTLLLLIAVYACIELREFFPKGSDPRNALKSWHFMLGLTVFGLTLLRIVARWFNPSPAKDSRITAWQRYASSVMHFMLYALLLVMPLLGWAILSAEGKAIIWFGLELPALIAPNKEWAEQLEELHVTAGTVGYFLIGLHALAALFHHYVQRDTTLVRMLPARD